MGLVAATDKKNADAGDFAWLLRLGGKGKSEDKSANGEAKCFRFPTVA
jgi:hypothetical protein